MWFTQCKKSRQSKDRPGAFYVEALWREGKRATYTISLGFLTEDERRAAEARLRSLGRGLLATVPADGEPLLVEGIEGPVVPDEPLLPGAMVFSKDEIRRAALTDTSIESLLGTFDRLDLEDRISSGAYGDLTLSEFVESIYGPVRQAQQSPRNWTRERHLWNTIHKVLGRIKTKHLNRVRWDHFLAGMTSRWSPRTKSIAQQHFLRAMRYALSVGAIEQVPNLDPVPGGNDVSGEPGDSLTAEEVPLVLAAASNDMHRCLFATAIGQGTRPDEVVRADWSDVDWSRNVMRFAGFQGRRARGKNKQASYWVPITPLTMPHLRAWWDACGRPTEGLVFTWRGRGFTSWRRAWSRAIDRSGIDPERRRRIVPYSARYTYATLGALAGVAPAAMRTGMRHTSESRVMERVYQRLHAEQVQSAFEAFPSCSGPETK